MNFNLVTQAVDGELFVWGHLIDSIIPTQLQVKKCGKEMRIKHNRCNRKFLLQYLKEKYPELKEKSIIYHTHNNTIELISYEISVHDRCRIAIRETLNLIEEDKYENSRSFRFNKVVEPAVKEALKEKGYSITEEKDYFIVSY